MADAETRGRIDNLLSRSVALNDRNARAYSFLAETRSLLGTGDPIGLVRRAIQLEPGEAAHRLVAARILARARNYDDAIKVAQLARSLAASEEERREADELIANLERNRK
jgi:hypothetical protein